MITIQTVNSKIIWADGTFPTGLMVITPVDSFQYTESDGKRKKVSLDDIEIDFKNGLIVDSSGTPATFNIAPTLNASQDKTALYYIVTYYIGDSTYTEYWAIDASGAGTLELTDIVKVIPDSSGAAIIIVQNVRLFISQYQPTPDPADTDIAQWRQIDGSGNTVQVYEWAGTSGGWRMIA